MNLRAIEVFTPNDFPVHTYVERDGAILEHRLSESLKVPKAVVSISGPSKSGKTVLIERVVSRENLIVVSGADIRLAEDLWSRILDWMDVPSSTSAEIGRTQSDQYSTSASGGFGLPGILSGAAKAVIGAAESKLTKKTAIAGRSGLIQVEREIGNSDFIVLVDDFHYMERNLQTEVARQIKAGAERGIRFCVASVPHRSDDVVRSNPELRGRTTNIDSTFWSIDELAQIARQGFTVLEVNFPEQQIRRLAQEACGSPQLMQSICLHACSPLRVDEEGLARPLDGTLMEQQLQSVFETTSSQTDYSSLVMRGHEGPKVRGQERKVHHFKDGTKGDVYRCILLVIAQDAPVMGLSWNELNARVQAVCVGETPAGSSIKEACRQLAKIAIEMYPQQRIVEWDEEADNLTIVDPYFLFYTRSSPKLRQLAQ
jgi:hypothetical protein